jgi:hypothetical protein
MPHAFAQFPQLQIKMSHLTEIRMTLAKQTP